MICTSLIPCLSIGLVKNKKLCPCLSYFPGFFGHFVSLSFFENLGGDKPYTKAVKQDVLRQFFQAYSNYVTIFQKCVAILTKE